MHSVVIGHLGCFHVLTFVNSAAMSIGVQASFWIMVFLGFMRSSGIAMSYGSELILNQNLATRSFSSKSVIYILAYEN